MLVVPVSPRRFLELALDGGIDARIAWSTAFALSKRLEVPFPTLGECEVNETPEEFLVARLERGELRLFHVTVGRCF